MQPSEHPLREKAVVLGFQSFHEFVLLVFQDQHVVKDYAYLQSSWSRSMKLYAGGLACPALRHFP
jgi:hypothetical protein